MSLPLSRTAVRIGGALGLAHVVVTLAGFAVSGPSQDALLGAPLAKVVSYYAEADAAQVFTGGYLELIGYLLFVPFAVILCRYAATPDSDAGVASSTGRVAAGIYVANVLAPGFAAGAGALYAAQHGAGGDVVYGLNLLRTFSYFTALAALAVFVASVSVAGLVGRTLPRWLVGTGLVLAVALVAGIAGAADGWADIPGFLSFAWLLAVSIWLIRRPRRSATTTATAPQARVAV